MTSNPQSQIALSTPAALSAGEDRLLTMASSQTIPTGEIAVGQGETLPTSGLLLLALIALVAVSRRGLRQVGKKQ